MKCSPLTKTNLSKWWKKSYGMRQPLWQRLEDLSPPCEKTSYSLLGRWTSSCYISFYMPLHFDRTRCEEKLHDVLQNAHPPLPFHVTHSVRPWPSAPGIMGVPQMSLGGVNLCQLFTLWLATGRPIIFTVKVQPQSPDGKSRLMCPG